MERLLQAEVSSDLAESPVSTGVVSDVDVVRAVGAVARSPRSELGLALWRVFEARDLAEFPTVLAGLMREAQLRGMEDPGRQVEQLVLYMLDPICPACHGRGQPVIEGTNVLSGADCTHCEGTGRRTSELNEGQRALLYAAQALQDDAARMIARKLR